MKKEEIVRMLFEAGTYVSGQELCEHFGVSRTAVWKAIKQLEKEGYQIEAVNNKGYLLKESRRMMSGIEIARYMETTTMGKNLFFHKETGSTNIDAKKLAEEGVVEGTLVVADSQNAGRGRRGRTWISTTGSSIYMSLLLRPRCTPNQAPALTLVMALSVLQAVKEVSCVPGGIKWPNDVVLNNKKICGILTEMSTEMDEIHYVVIGVGINVNQEEMDAEIADKATSLRIELGERVNRCKLVPRIMYYFEQNYHKFQQTYDLSGLAEQYNENLINRGKEVRVLDPKNEFTGIAEGINEQGELLVRKADQTLEAVFAGEVSVRGIYGYV